MYPIRLPASRTEFGELAFKVGDLPVEASGRGVALGPPMLFGEGLDLGFESIGLAAALVAVHADKDGGDQDDEQQERSKQYLHTFSVRCFGDGVKR